MRASFHGVLIGGDLNPKIDGCCCRIRLWHLVDSSSVQIAWEMKGRQHLHGGAYAARRRKPPQSSGTVPRSTNQPISPSVSPPANQSAINWSLLCFFFSPSAPGRSSRHAACGPVRDVCLSPPGDTLFFANVTLLVLQCPCTLL